MKIKVFLLFSLIIMLALFLFGCAKKDVVKPGLESKNDNTSQASDPNVSSEDESSVSNPVSSNSDSVSSKQNSGNSSSLSPSSSPSSSPSQETSDGTPSTGEPSNPSFPSLPLLPPGENELPMDILN